MDMAKKVYRPDIYAVAAKELIAEGRADAKDFPAFDKESGFRAPQTEFIDKVVFDGTQPNAYLASFKIGLKGKELVK